MEENKKIKLEENERIDDLQFKNLKIIQNSKGFCFGMDSVLLSDFAKNIKNNSFVLDLGTGTGIIPILLCGKTKLKKIIGIEIQKQVSQMAKESVKMNNLENRITIINEDVKKYSKTATSEYFDIITCKPPYFEVLETSKFNKNDYKTIARHEVNLNLEDILKISRKLLKNGGTLGLVHRPERLIDILITMRKYNIEN